MSFWDDLFGKGHFRGPSACPYPQAVSQGKPYTMAMVDGENAEITMYGEIRETQPVDWWTGEPVPGTYIIQDEFLKDLETIAGAKALTIRMDSIGGDAGVSILIHNRLRGLAAKGTRLKCIVDGVAMSGGSLIMCACDNVEVNPSSLIMIHKSWGPLWGGYNADELREIAARYDAWDKAQVAIYKRKCNLSDTVILNMMSKTTYMTGAEAVEKGFADRVLDDAEPLEIATSADKRSLFVRGRQFHLAPGMYAPDTIPVVKSGILVPAKTNTNPPAQTGGKGGKTMAKNLEGLRAENPELAEALMAEAKAAVPVSQGITPPASPLPTPDTVRTAIQAEQKRIQEIDAVADLYDADTVQAAKYGDTACTAQEMTYRAAQKAAQQGRKFLAALEADTAASGAQDVGAANGGDSDGTGGEDTPQSMAAQAKADVAAFEKMKEVR